MPPMPFTPDLTKTQHSGHAPASTSTSPSLPVYTDVFTTEDAFTTDIITISSRDVALSGSLENMTPVGILEAQLNSMLASGKQIYGRYKLDGDPGSRRVGGAHFS